MLAFKRFVLILLFLSINESSSSYNLDMYLQNGIYGHNLDHNDKIRFINCLSKISNKEILPSQLIRKFGGTQADVYDKIVEPVKEILKQQKVTAISRDILLVIFKSLALGDAFVPQKGKLSFNVKETWATTIVRQTFSEEFIEEAMGVLDTIEYDELFAEYSGDDSDVDVTNEELEAVIAEYSADGKIVDDENGYATKWLKLRHRLEYWAFDFILRVIVDIEVDEIVKLRSLAADICFMFYKIMKDYGGNLDIFDKASQLIEGQLKASANEQRTLIIKLEELAFSALKDSISDIFSIALISYKRSIIRDNFIADIDNSSYAYIEILAKDDFLGLSAAHLDVLHYNSDANYFKDVYKNQVNRVSFMLDKFFNEKDAVDKFIDYCLKKVLDGDFYQLNKKVVPFWDSLVGAYNKIANNPANLNLDWNN